MAEFTDRIKLIYDVVADKAATETGKVKASMAEAEGAFGKAKAGAAGLFSTLGQVGPQALAGAAVAVGAFALDAMGKFTELAEAARNFSTAAGTSTEDASRWIETAGDLNVPIDAVQAAMGRLNREAASGKLADFGVQADNASDRLVLTLEKIAAIPDENARAQASFDLLGKGGAALAPLLANVDSLRDRLASVQGNKLISDEDTAAAQALADQVDDLKESWEQLQLAVGKAAIPLAGMLADLAGLATAAADAAQGKVDASTWDRLAEGAKTYANIVTTVAAPPLAIVRGRLESFLSTSKDVVVVQKDAKVAAAEAAAALEDQAEAAAEADAKLQDLTDSLLAAFNSQLGLASAADKTEDAFKKYAAEAAKANEQSWGNAEANEAAADAQREAESAALAQAAAAVKLAEDQAKANGETLTAQQRNSILAGQLRTMASTLEPGSPLRVALEGYVKDLEAIPDTATTTVDVVGEEEALRKLRGLYQWIQEHQAGFDIPIGFPGINSTATSSGANVVPITAAPSAAAMGLGAVPTAGPVVLQTVYHVPVMAGPIVGNQAELGRLVANALIAHERRVGQRRRFV